MKRTPYTILWLTSALGLGACGEQVNVSIDCVTASTPALECTLVQTLGTAEVEVCWDAKITCGNGQVVTAPRTCQKISEGATVKAVIPKDTLTDFEKCTPGEGGKPVMALSNLTFNGKKSEF